MLDDVGDTTLPTQHNNTRTSTTASDDSKTKPSALQCAMGWRSLIGVERHVGVHAVCCSVPVVVLAAYVFAASVLLCLYLRIVAI